MNQLVDDRSFINDTRRMWPSLIGFLAFAATGCQLFVSFDPVPEELAQCLDQVDNDEDGDIDCADSGCATVAACTPGCGNGIIDPLSRFAFTPTEYTVAAPVGLAAATIGLETTTDVVVASRDGAVVELRGGGGTFTAQAPLPVVRATLTAIAAASFDSSGTGAASVLVTETMQDELVTYPPDPMFGLGPPFRSETSFAPDPVAIVAADFESDDDIDVVVASSGGAPTYLRNQSGDGFALSSPQLAERPTALAAGDVDGDGDTDLVFAAAATDRVVVLSQVPGTPTEDLPLAAGPPIAVGDEPVALVIADVDGAGRPDLVVANGGSANLTVLLASSTGFTAATPVSLGARPLSLAAADLDGDGHTDLAVGLPGARVAVYTGDGDGGFTLAHTQTVDGDPVALLVLRVNADALPDLLTAETGANRVTLLINATVRETCDDGNTTDGDACPADCTQP